jgi:hypothetical protein
MRAIYQAGRLPIGTIGDDSFQELKYVYQQQFEVLALSKEFASLFVSK